MSIMFYHCLLIAKMCKFFTNNVHYGLCTFHLFQCVWHWHKHFNCCLPQLLVNWCLPQCLVNWYLPQLLVNWCLPQFLETERMIVHVVRSLVAQLWLLCQQYLSCWSSLSPQSSSLNVYSSSEWGGLGTRLRPMQRPLTLPPRQLMFLSLLMRHMLWPR